MKKNLFIGILAFINLTIIFAREQDSLYGAKMIKRVNAEKAIFAGGCFWCIESAFEELPGVVSAVSGYTGGKTANPTYEEVSSGTTDHVEAVEITYDPTKIAYKDLLAVFWKNIDPTDTGGQFADRGSQYGTAIFYVTDEQKREAEESKKELEESGRFDKPIATKILKASQFYPAEEYHQAYYKKEPEHYKQYRVGSGREAYLERTWKKDFPSCGIGSGPKRVKPSDKELKSKLSTLSYNVIHGGTEPAFNNAYWNNREEGIYVDIVSGEPLFSSKDKFDSGTGWPSFMRPLVSENVAEKADTSHGMRRIEVKSCQAGSHLGHLFQDGPQPTGLRYCINSAALRFIPKKDLEKEGYGEYKKLFESE